MKKTILLLILPIPLFAQLQITFNDSSLNHWSGDTNHYQIDSLQQLQLVAPYQSSTSTIYHSSQAILNGKWEIEVGMDFNPSSSNYCQIYLSMDQDENGYFIRVGGTDDKVSLFRSKDNQNSKIIDGINDFLNIDSVKIKIKVERDSVGNWQLWAKNKNSQWVLQGSGFDDSFNMSQTFAISCTYTSTRSQKFFFDNISLSGTSFVDTFAIPKANDIIINEVLFNPLDGDKDFVEIYNRSGKALNIKNLMLGNYYGGRPDNFKLISPSFLIMEPAEILVLSSSTNDLMFYHTEAIEEKIIELQSMPAYNNQNGTVVLQLESIIIDEFNYHEDLHFPYLNSFDGVSLERIDSEINSDRKDNWHSASEQSGFSSPTLENSQKNLKLNDSEVLICKPELISPNNDGIDDFLQIDIQLEAIGYNANILLFDSKGILINTLVSNIFLGSKNTFYWNGLDQNGNVVPMGRYIILLNAIHTSNPIISQKKTVVVTY